MANWKLQAGLAVSALALSSAAFAQSTDTNTDAAQQGAATADDGLGDIVVTAQRRSENVQDVPIAVSAVGSAYLDSRGVQSITDLGGIAPNVKFERSPNTTSVSQIAIRGSVTINPAITWEPAVGLYLDGVYIAKSQGSIFNVADLERVEILRGPQGTLYGRNALAGAVNLVTRGPTGEFGGRAEVGFGSYDQITFRGALNLPQIGPFSIKLAGQYERRAGLTDIVASNLPGVFSALPPSIGEAQTIRNGSFMVQVKADISDSITANYNFDYSRVNQDPPFAQLVHVNQNGDPRDIFDPNSPSYLSYFPLDRFVNRDRQSVGYINEDVFERSRSYGHALTLTADLGPATLKSITAYRDMSWEDRIDLDGSDMPVAVTARLSDYWAFSQELQLLGSLFNDRLEYQAGAFYFKERAQTDNPQTYFGGASDYSSFYGSHTEALAFYTQLDYHFNDQWKLTLGGRYTHERKDIRRFLRINADLANGITTPTVIADIGYGDVPDATYSDFSPAVTLSYQPVQNVNIYARYARGFKSGGFNGETNVFFDPNAPAGCPFGATELCEPYRPETVASYELGIKTRLFNNRVTFNIAAFRDEHKDMQLAIFTAAGAASSIVRNAGSARIQGLEFELIARPVDGIVINGSLALLDADYRRFVDGGVDVSNNRAFPHAPKVTASAGFDWRVAQGDWGRFNLYGDVSHVSSYYTYPYALVGASASDQVAGNTRSSGRTTVNLRAAISDIEVSNTKWTASVFVRNLTNENRLSNFIDFGPGFGGLTVGYYPDPRTWGLTLGTEF